MPKKPAPRKKVPKTTAVTKRRQLALPKRVWYKPLTWRHRPPMPMYKPLPKARSLFARTMRLLWGNKKLFGGIALIYGILNVLLVRGLSGGGNVLELKSELDALLSGFGGKIASSLVAFFGLLGSSGASVSATGGLYQSVLLVVCSLAIIWALRQVTAKHTVRIRDAFYKGMYPLIPFVFILFLIGLQLLPMTLGAGLYSVTTNYGVTTNALERGSVLLIAIALALWSLRLITASLFAFYIVTLPGMTPWAAYRNARKLVYRRRLLVWRKLIFLPVILMLAAVVIEVPFILFIAPVAVWLFFALTMVALPIAHGYLYNLYREML